MRSLVVALALGAAVQVGAMLPLDGTLAALPSGAAVANAECGIFCEPSARPEKCEKVVAKGKEKKIAKYCA